jgi:hypothetical protein
LLKDFREHQCYFIGAFWLLLGVTASSEQDRRPDANTNDRLRDRRAVRGSADLAALSG